FALRLAAPPIAGSPALRPGTAVVVDDTCTDEFRRRVWKRILLEQCQNVRRSLEQAVQELHEPGIASIGPQGRKPHLPIQPRLVRRYPGKASLGIAGFIREFISQPRSAVPAPFDNDLGTGCGHDSEETIPVDEVERRDEAMDDCCKSSHRPDRQKALC